MKAKKIWVMALFLLLPWGNISAQYSTMSDQQVLEYAKSALEQGKDQRQIANELVRRGVTREQAERVKKLYDQQQAGASTGEFSVGEESRLRQVRRDTATSVWGDIATPLQMRQGQIVPGMLEPTDQVQSMPWGYEQNQNVFGNYESSQMDPWGLGLGPVQQPEEQVFGRSIFNTRNLTFEPSVNLATPPNYRLGPGDEVIIDIWGASQTTIRQTISPDGTINLQELGPAYLSGMTVKEASEYLKGELGKVYSNEDNQIKVTLGNARTIQINIMGEVTLPGTYALSAFSTVFHALYRAGGVNEIGSLRNVLLVRDGAQVASVDVYDFIMHGRIDGDIHLQEGDVVIVPAYELMVKIDGNVKRSMRFEMKADETLATLIDYAGGFDADAYSKTLRIVRQNGEEYEVKTVDAEEYATTSLRNGDRITVGALLDRFTNRVEIRGAVYRPDIYELSEEVSTVRALIEKAEGLMDDAFTNRAVLRRERDNLTSEMLSVDVKALLDGRVSDIPLRKNDILYIPSIHDLQDLGNVEILGEVARPDSYPYADNMTLEDLIIQAGGLNEAASTVRVDVSRRVKDPKNVSGTDSIGQMFSFALKDGFIIDGEPGFVLQPYDQVFVRRSPGYQEQQNVEVKGEVLFGGTYTLTTKTERLSDLIKKAGGVKSSAYVRGAKLTRVANEEEKKRMQDVINLMGRELGEGLLDSLNIKVDSTYTVGIDLEAALAEPGGDADLVVREGDVLIVPEYTNTVKISGAVMMPNTVAYKEGENVKYYLAQAGGYSQHAKKNKKFIIYMNGQVAEVKRRGGKQIEPGCEIVVPNKRRRNGAALTSILSYATSFASLGTMAASIANLVK